MLTKNRKTAIVVLLLMLLVSVSLGNTLAFMTRETAKAENNFSFASQDEAINAMLTEPAWDGIIDYIYDENDGTLKNVVYGYTYIDDDGDPRTPEVVDNIIYGYKNGDRSKPVYTPNGDGAGMKATFDSTDPSFNPKYGADTSRDMVPGQSANKNPLITNTGRLLDEWVAVKVTFVYGVGSAKAGQPLSIVDMVKVTDIITINWNTGNNVDNWERISGAATSVSQVFFYRDILHKGPEEEIAGKYGESTEPIFTTVDLISTASAAQLKYLEDIGGFTIYIEGFAAQGDVGQDYDSFKEFGLGGDKTFGNDDDGVVFNNTPTEMAPAVVTNPGIIEK